eukprot:SAG31_NODE_2643_length_5320_cov_13.447998_4_plen_88_part_00
MDVNSFTEADLMVKIIKTFDMTQPAMQFHFCSTDAKSIHFSEWAYKVWSGNHVLFTCECGHPKARHVQGHRDQLERVWLQRCLRLGR